MERLATEIEFVVELPRVLTRLTDFLRSVGFTYVNGMSVVPKVMILTMTNGNTTTMIWENILEKLSPFTFIKNLSDKSGGHLLSDTHEGELNEKSYSPFIVNRGMSMHRDLALRTIK